MRLQPYAEDRVDPTAVAPFQTPDALVYFSISFVLRRHQEGRGLPQLNFMGLGNPDGRTFGSNANVF
jgi:hypothetical protein